VSAGRRVPSKAWVVFAAGTVAYLCAVLQRSTLGVAGVAASERFDASAAALSTLAVLQLAVYAALQVPVGVLVDRFGPRILLATGAVLMAAGQVLVAIAPSLPLAVVGRVLVGGGDATTFIAVLRLVATWFPGPRVPLLNQWVGNVGQLGQVLSAVPFAALLSLGGWQSAFLAAAGVAGVALVVVLLLVVDDVPGRPRQRAADLREALAALGAAVRRPGTQLGFWSHFVTQSSGVVFALFWGYPFLVRGVGLDPAVAASLLTLQVLAALAVGPVLGVLTARHPLRRSNLVLTIVAAMAIAWTLVLLWPGRPPVLLLALLVVAIGVGGPGSQIGFDYARTFNPARSLGGATGAVNVGGFTASFTMMLAIGMLLDLQHTLTGAPAYGMQSFRIAFTVQYLVVGGGLVALLVARRRARRLMADDEGVVVDPLWTAVAEAIRRRSARA
jgi:sugar phosphate permease